MTIVHSRACRDLLLNWWSQPRDSVRYRLAGFGYDHTDLEIRDLLLTIFADDPADSEAVAAARQLWPLLLLTDPLHAPEDLLDEIDALAADIARVQMRVELLAAKYRALEPWSERWNRAKSDAAESEWGQHNIDDTARNLVNVQKWLGHDWMREQLTEARRYAAKIREYDNTEAAQR